MIPSTPFPSRLIDSVMPTLRDTEWRVVCVVARQTLGWKLPSGERKRRDWLTHRQLMRRTGRSSEAVSKALDTLVRVGTLAVTGSAGETLDTPGKRRRYRGCLLYELVVPKLSTGGRVIHRLEATTASKTRHRKAGTTKENYT